MTEASPVFVAGPDRSGTSLMYAFLSSHPRISMSRRTYMWHYFRDRYGDLRQPENFERCLAVMLSYKRIRRLNPDPDRIRREFWQGEPSYARLFSLFHEHRAQRRGKPRWGDKSLQVEHYADKIFEDFPNARFVHMMRDPRDRYASVFKRYAVNRGQIGVAAAKWLYSSRQAIRNLEAFPDRYMVVRYEDLARQPEDTLRAVCAFIGEAYEPVMLSMEGAPDHVDKGGNSSFGRLAPGVISTKSIGRYRQVLSPHDIAFMQLQAGRLMEHFSYELDPIRFAPADRLRFALVHRPMNQARMLAWTAREAMRDRVGRTLPSYRIVADAETTHANASA